MNQNGEMIIKAKRNHNGEQIARKIIVNKDLKLEELEYKVNTRKYLSFRNSQVCLFIFGFVCLVT